MSLRMKFLLIALIPLLVLLVVEMISGNMFLQESKDITDNFDKYTLAVDALDKIGELKRAASLLTQGLEKLETVETLYNDLKKVEEGAKLADIADKKLDEIIRAVEKINNMLQNIAAAIEEQTAAVDEISQAMTDNAKNVEEINASVQEVYSLLEETGANVEEITAKVKSIRENAAKLKEVVARYRI